ncbi:PREDICTED: equilibrative nucleoside transporter 1-like isoform X2 [Priapulus caudatus]|uniref:Equilibrative nucleoside transporter 1-like isoform X2 n=1 Tax=Priapulus caudatus TaxID=37621 RepID=A0ABM1DVC6_PRICU|nr:PREDICTED: equilibrative nucleoside transporter 1-like isoform X2 [Priapulus caudatus]
MKGVDKESGSVSEATSDVKELRGNMGSYNDDEEKVTDQLLDRTDSGTPPSDKYYMVYLMMTMLGLGQLLPWNFFITANEYFTYKLRNTSHNASIYEVDDKTYLQITFENWFSVTSMVTNVVFVFVTSSIMHTLCANVRMFGAMSTMVVLFILTVIFTQVDTDSWQVAFFVITVLTVGILSSACAVIQASLFGLAGFFPQKYTSGVMAGQAIAGMFASLASIITLLGTQDDPLQSGFNYFLAATFAILIAIVSYLAIPRTDFGHYYLQHPDERTSDHLIAAKQAKGSGIGVKKEKPPFIAIFKKVKMEALSVWMVFFVTLSLFPPLTSNVQSVNKDSGTRWTNQFFIPVYCFLMFNVGDLIGRVVAAFIQWPRRGSYLLPLLCILRVGFIPLFLLCNIQPRGTIPVIFNTDIYPVVFMLLFATTNGYLASLCMMYGPQNVYPSDADTAGAICSAMMSFGLFAGSICAFVLVAFM